jgi:hypothetical protein
VGRDDFQDHRNDAGRFDLATYELMSGFLFRMLMPFLTEAHPPLGDFRNAEQSEDLPVELQITAAEGD